MNLGWWVTCFCLILFSRSFVRACAVWLCIGFTCKTVVLIIRYRCFYHWKQVCFHFIIVYYDRLFNKDTPKQLAFHKMSMACTQLSFSLINCIQNLRMIQICLVYTMVGHFICYLLNMFAIFKIGKLHHFLLVQSMMRLTMDYVRFMTKSQAFRGSFWIHLASGFYIYHHIKMTFQIRIITI